VYVLFTILAAQGIGMYVIGRHGLVQMTVVMVAAALAGNVAGYATTRSAAPVPKATAAEAVPS
jgi:hypothetical protein